MPMMLVKSVIMFPSAFSSRRCRRHSSSKKWSVTGCQSDRLTSDAVDLVSGDVQILKVAEVIDRGKAREAIAGDMQGTDTGRNATKIADPVIGAEVSVKNLALLTG